MEGSSPSSVPAIALTGRLATSLTRLKITHSGDRSATRSARSGSGSSDLTTALRKQPSSAPFAARASSSLECSGEALQRPPRGQLPFTDPDIVADRDHDRVLALAALAVVERDERPRIPAARASRQLLRVVDVSEGAVERAVQTLGVRGVVLADGEPPLGVAGPRPVDVEVRRVEDDPVRARGLARAADHTVVEGADAVGVVALEAQGVGGRVVGDRAGRDEGDARERDGDLREVVEFQDARPGDEPEAPGRSHARHVVEDIEEGARVVVAADHDGRRDLRQPLQGGDAEPEGGVGGAVGVEEVARVDDQVGAFGGADRRGARGGPCGGRAFGRGVRASRRGASRRCGGVSWRLLRDRAALFLFKM